MAAPGPFEALLILVLLGGCTLVVAGSLIVAVLVANRARRAGGPPRPPAPPAVASPATTATAASGASTTYVSTTRVGRRSTTVTSGGDRVVLAELQAERTPDGVLLVSEQARTIRDEPVAPLVIEGTPAASLEELGKLAPGTGVALRGRVHMRSVVVLERFAAYVAQEFRGLSDDEPAQPTWRAVELVTPPLVLELPDGIVRVLAERYALRLRIEERWQDGVPLGRTLWPTGATFSWDEGTGLGSRRYAGIEPGDTVVVRGERADQGDEVIVRATEVVLDR